MEEKSKYHNKRKNVLFIIYSLHLYTDSLKIDIVDLLLFVIMLVGLVTNILSTIIWLKQVRTKIGALFIGCLSFADALYCLAIFLFTITTFVQEMSQCTWYMGMEVTLIFENASR